MPRLPNSAAVLKTQVFLYDADTERLGWRMARNEIAKNILESYSEAEFFTKPPDVPEKIEVVTYLAGVGDISTDLPSPGNQAHSRSDRELHGKSMISEAAQNEIKALQEEHPGKSVMLWPRRGRWGGVFPHVRREQCRPVDRQTGEPVCAVREYLPVVAGTMQDPDLPDDGECDGRDRY